MNTSCVIFLELNCQDCTLPCVFMPYHTLSVFCPEIDFNVSGAFVLLPAVNSNHLSHTGNEYESGTQERKRPVSMAVMEGDLLKKERYVGLFALISRHWPALGQNY